MTTTLIDCMALARRTLVRGEAELAGEIAVLALAEADDPALSRAARIARAAEMIDHDDLENADDILKDMDLGDQARQDADDETLEGRMGETLNGDRPLKQDSKTFMQQPQPDATPQQASVLQIANRVLGWAGQLAEINPEASQSLGAAAKIMAGVSDA